MIITAKSIIKDFKCEAVTRSPKYMHEIYENISRKQGRLLRSTLHCDFLQFSCQRVGTILISHSHYASRDLARILVLLVLWLEWLEWRPIKRSILTRRSCAYQRKYASEKKNTLDHRLLRRIKFFSFFPSFHSNHYDNPLKFTFNSGGSGHCSK